MSTVSTALTVDVDALNALAAKGKADPSKGHKTVRTHTVCESGFRNWTTVRDLEPVLVSEPPALLGDDAAPNPTEVALAALGSCISVGLVANATFRGITLSRVEVGLEGDIDVSAVWGVGDTPAGKVLGLTAVRASITLAGDADPEVLREIHDNALAWSPVVNTFTRPVEFSSQLTVA